MKLPTATFSWEEKEKLSVTLSELIKLHNLPSTVHHTSFLLSSFTHSLLPLVSLAHIKINYSIVPLSIQSSENERSNDQVLHQLRGSEESCDERRWFGSGYGWSSRCGTHLFHNPLGHWHGSLLGRSWEGEDWNGVPQRHPRKLAAGQRGEQVSAQGWGAQGAKDQDQRRHCCGPKEGQGDPDPAGGNGPGQRRQPEALRSQGRHAGDLPDPDRRNQWAEEEAEGTDDGVSGVEAEDDERVQGYCGEKVIIYTPSIYLYSCLLLNLWKLWEITIV